MSDKRINPYIFTIPVLAMTRDKDYMAEKFRDSILFFRGYKTAMASKSQSNGVSFNQMMAQYTSIK